MRRSVGRMDPRVWLGVPDCLARCARFVVDARVRPWLRLCRNGITGSQAKVQYRVLFREACEREAFCAIDNFNDRHGLLASVCNQEHGRKRSVIRAGETDLRAAMLEENTQNAFAASPEAASLAV